MILFAYESEEMARGKEKCPRRRFRIWALYIYIYIYIYKVK